jgi:hypothetical protein
VSVKDDSFVGAHPFILFKQNLRSLYIGTARAYVELPSDHDHFLIEIDSFVGIHSFIHSKKTISGIHTLCRYFSYFLITRGPVLSSNSLLYCTCWKRKRKRRRNGLRNHDDIIPRTAHGIFSRVALTLPSQ